MSEMSLRVACCATLKIFTVHLDYPDAKRHKAMDMVRKINEELAITGQPAPNKLSQLVEDGYRSVVNLRSPDEAGFWSEEQQEIEQLGLRYANYPVQVNPLNPEVALQLIQKITELPKPILLHCDNGVRSSIIALMQIAVKQGMRTEEALQKITNLGLLNNS